MKYLTIIFFSLLLFGCKTPQKTIVESTKKEDISINNDIALNDEKHLSELVDRFMERITKDRLKININQTKYDTDKPVDPETGKHPVIEENEINIDKETDVQETKNTHQQKDSVSNTILQDQSQIKIKTDSGSKEQTETGSNKTRNILIGVVIALALVLFIIIKKK